MLFRSGRRNFDDITKHHADWNNTFRYQDKHMKCHTCLSHCMTYMRASVLSKCICFWKIKSSFISETNHHCFEKMQIPTEPHAACNSNSSIINILIPTRKLLWFGKRNIFMWFMVSWKNLVDIRNSIKYLRRANPFTSILHQLQWDHPVEHYNLVKCGWSKF